MSRIVVMVEQDGSLRPELLRALREATGQPLAVITDAIRSRSPLMECLLFMNDHDEAASTLRSIVSATNRHGAMVHFYELRPEEHYEFTTGSRESCRMQPSTLLNMLDEWDRMRRSEDS